MDAGIGDCLCGAACAEYQRGVPGCVCGQGLGERRCVGVVPDEAPAADNHAVDSPDGIGLAAY